MGGHRIPRTLRNCTLAPFCLRTIDINNLLIQRAQIYGGDILKIGSYAFEFCSTSSIKVDYFEQIENLLQIDFLTRAHNRSFLEYFLQEEIRHKVSETPFVVDSTKTIPVTLSLGVSTFEVGMDVQNFIKTADEKMRMAKKKGRNQVY